MVTATDLDRIREGLRIAGTKAEAADLYGEIRPEHFHMPTCAKANGGAKNKLTKEGFKASGDSKFQPRELSMYRKLFQKARVR